MNERLFCGLCGLREEETNTFKTIVSDLIMITKKICCEECREEFEYKPNTPYTFHKKEVSGDNIHISNLSKGSNSLSAKV